MFHKRYYHKQKGLGLPSALFLIVVLVLLLATMNQLNEVNTTAYGRQWLSLRAFLVAESGAQMSAVQALNSQQIMSACDNNFIDDQGIATTGLTTCVLNVSCSSQLVSGDTYYTFTSEGRCGSGADTATRIIQIRLRL